MPTTAAELLVKVSADTAQAESDLRSFSSRMLSGAGGMGAVFGGTLLTAGVQAGVRAVGSLGRGVVGLGADALQSGASFEYAMDQVTAVLGGTEAEAQRLNDTALALGMNPNLKVGVDEVAAGMYTLATAGITADQIIGGAMESTILLGNAAGASMDQSAEVTTKAMSIFKLGASDLGNVVDGAVGVLNASTYSLEDYAYFVANAGGTAAALGLSIDEMNQAAVVMAPSFSTGRTAATSFDAMLKGLSPTTAAAKDAMAALGMTTEDGANIFFDAAGDVVAFDDIYRNLVRTMGGLDAKTQMDMASAIFGEAGGAAAIALIRTTGDEYTRLQKIVGDTDALQQATIRTDNLNSKWDTFKDSIQSVKIAAFDAVKVPLTMAFEALMPAVSFLGPIVIGWAEQAGAWLETNIPILQVRIPLAVEAWNSAPGAISGIAAAIGVLSGKEGELAPVVADLSAMDAALKAFSTEGANPFPALFAGIAAALTGGTAAFDAATGAFTASFAAFQVEMSKTGEVTITINWTVVNNWLNATADSANAWLDATFTAWFGSPHPLSAEQLVNIFPDFHLDMSQWPPIRFANWLGEQFGLTDEPIDHTQPVTVTPDFSPGDTGFSLKEWLVEKLFGNGEPIEITQPVIITPTISELSAQNPFDATGPNTVQDLVNLYAGRFTPAASIPITLTPEFNVQDIQTSLTMGGETLTIPAQANVAGVDFNQDQYQADYDVGAIVANEPVWGPYSTLYDVGANVSRRPHFGNWTWDYKVTATVTHVNNLPAGGGAADAQATGTLSARGGLTWVGERGPELVALPGASRVWNNRESMAMAGAGGPQVVMYNSVADAIDLEVLARRVGQYLRMG